MLCSLRACICRQAWRAVCKLDAPLTFPAQPHLSLWRSQTGWSGRPRHGRLHTDSAEVGVLYVPQHTLLWLCKQPRHFSGLANRTQADLLFAARRFDVEQGQWHTCCSMSRPRGSLSVSELSGAFFCVGGGTPTRQYDMAERCRRCRC